MNKIIFKAEMPKETKSKRHAVVIKNETYHKIMLIKNRTGIPIETIVETLLVEALNNVEIIDDID